ncbi:MAG: CapA family protein [Clostridium sp.]
MKKRSCLLLVVLSFMLLIVGCTKSQKPKEEGAVEAIAPPEKIETIEIMAIGDLLIHGDFNPAQFDNNSGKYDYNSNFAYMKDILSSPDLTIANLETTLSGKENGGFSGYPVFNTPDEFAEAVKNTGIDVVPHMNNHSMDKGANGFKRTRKTLVDNGLQPIGTREKLEDKKYIIKDVKGIKVGINSYGYSTTTNTGQKALNGIPVPNDVGELMNTFDINNVEKSFDEMKKDINDMRADGADIIVFYMHWGDEYAQEPNQGQRKIAQFLADNNVDIIFGTHPHRIQPIETLKSKDGKHETQVIYSMGNFISGQRIESVNRNYTEDGVMTSVKASKNFTTGEIKVEKPTYLPTWVNLTLENGKKKYQTVPATVFEGEYITPDKLKRIQDSLKRTDEVIKMYDSSLMHWKK